VREIQTEININDMIGYLTYVTVAIDCRCRCRV